MPRARAASVAIKPGGNSLEGGGDRPERRGQRSCAGQPCGAPPTPPQEFDAVSHTECLRGRTHCLMPPLGTVHPCVCRDRNSCESRQDRVQMPKFEQLRQYVKQWSMNYEGDRKGTGLTTPVLVRKSRKLPSKFEGVEARSGVRILFQTTNTGDRYKSATEEKREEKERSSVTKKAPATTNAKPIITKAQKEGGVEVLVEKTTEGNIRVRARRCNVDNKTIVKEMSEEVIVKSLKSALQAWVEARSTTGF